MIGVCPECEVADNIYLCTGEDGAKVQLKDTGVGPEIEVLDMPYRSYRDQNPLRFYRCDNCGRRFDEPKWVR